MVVIGALTGCSHPSGSSRTAAAGDNAGAIPAPAKQRMYFGTYGQGKEAGVHLAEFDPATGKVGDPHLAGSAVNPSFLALHPNGKFLYAVSEAATKKGDPSGSVIAFEIDAKTGDLKRLNEESSKGADPCHLVVDKLGKNVLVANYTGGNVAVLPIGEDGRLKPASDMQQHSGKDASGKAKKPNGHSINLDRANKFAIAADLGLDQLIIYKFDAAAGKLTPHSVAKVAPGAGPRHFAFHPTEKFAYVINETRNTMTAFTYDAEKGTLTEIQTLSTLPAGYSGTSYTAEVVVHPNGKFLYGSNRGNDTIAIFSIDPATGKLTSLGHEPTQGKFPRNFAIDPSGTFLFAENMESNNTVVFKLDPQTGKLTPTGQTLKISQPCCIKFQALP